MRFTLTDEQEAFRETVREFAREEIEPTAAELDQREEYPGEILDALAETGLTGLTLPEEYGGQDGDLVDLVLAVEELSAAMMPVASAFALHLGVATVIERFGSEELKTELLPSMARFETVGALGLSEENAGSDKLAKFYATEAAVENTNEAFQLHGGIGYTTERDIERYLRDARLLTIAGGPNELHRNTVADAVIDE